MTWWMILMLMIYGFACLFLIFVILIQSGKGGGLSSLGQASGGLSESLGATGAEKALNKMTTVSAVAFMVLAILISIAGTRAIRQSETILGDQTSVTAPPIGGIPTVDDVGVDAGPAAGTAPDAAPPEASVDAPVAPPSDTSEGQPIELTVPDSAAPEASGEAPPAAPAEQGN